MRMRIKQQKKMAALSRLSQRLLRAMQTSLALKAGQNQKWTAKRCIFTFIATATGGGALYVCQTWMRNKDTHLLPIVYALPSQDEGLEDTGDKKLTYRETRFNQFASVEYDGNIYMTPQDFLESVTLETPRARIGRAKLTHQEVEAMLAQTPRRNRGSDHLFRNLHSKGIISYTEYLFLLCVLTKPHSGFRIAFNMFDTDGNQRVEKKEFLVLESFFILPKNERKFVPRDEKKLQKILDLEKVFSKQGKEKPQEESTRVHMRTQEVPDTTLLIHFFGSKGKDDLEYKDFHMFMENLQSEVIELEFMEFSRGMNSISEVDFAKILLRYTNLDRAGMEDALERVRTRMPEEKGIPFQEFKKFCLFLNSLDDFSLTMKMYTYAQKPVSQEDFQRAVKVCTAYTLSPHLVNTVFQIFDRDGDGNLSHQEFINIMKDRLQRGARSHLMQTQNTWDTFRACVRNEMRSL